MFLNKPGFGAGFGTTGFGGGDSWKGTNKSEQSFFDFGNHYRLNENKKTSMLTKAQDAMTGHYKCQKCCAACSDPILHQPAKSISLKLLLHVYGNHHEVTKGYFCFLCSTTTKSATSTVEAS
eukprot:sb/3476017/